MLHAFGVAYFDWGWIVATLVGLTCGPVSSMFKHHRRVLAIYICSLAVVGVIALIGKYGSA